MSFPTSGSDGSEMPTTIDPRLLDRSAGGQQGMGQAPAANRPAGAQPANGDDPFAFSPPVPGPSSGYSMLNGPAGTTIVLPPAATVISTAGAIPGLFGPYACPLPRFDIDVLADGLGERDRTFSPPQGDDVDAVSDDQEGWVMLVRAALARGPDHPTPQETRMCEQFVTRMQRIENRDIVVTQVAAEIVRAVIKLHTPSPVGESQVDGFVEGGDDTMMEGRVDVGPQAEVIGDHFRTDQIAHLQPDARDYQLTATARLNKICEVLRQTKKVANNVFNGRDTITMLVAAPFRVQAKNSPPQLQANQQQGALQQ